MSHASKFFTTLAIQLASNIPNLRQHIDGAISNGRNIANLSFRDQWRELIFNPLSELGSDFFSAPPVLIIIDALDECDKGEHIQIILLLLAEA